MDVVAVPNVTCLFCFLLVQTQKIFRRAFPNLGTQADSAALSRKCLLSTSLRMAEADP